MTGELFAVASKDGSTVDEHFGHATKLFIFFGSRSRVELIDTLEIEPYCTGDCDPEQRINDLLGKLLGCAYLLCLRIGYGPARQLTAAGIQPIESYGPTEEIIRAVAGGAGQNRIYRFAWPDPELTG